MEMAVLPLMGITFTFFMFVIMFLTTCVIMVMILLASGTFCTFDKDLDIVASGVDAKTAQISRGNTTSATLHTYHCHAYDSPYIGLPSPR